MKWRVDAMIIEETRGRYAGRAGFFFHAKLKRVPIVILENGKPLLFFMEGRVFAKAVGMTEEYGDPLPYMEQEGAKTIIRATEFQIIDDVLSRCIADNAPVIIRKYSHEYYIAMTPQVFEKYKHLFVDDKSSRKLVEKKLVAYFSVSGITAKVAELLADAVGADVHEICPRLPYTKADLNSIKDSSQNSIEMINKCTRPELATCDIDFSQYRVIYLGFPIWNGSAPTIIKTFLESHYFFGKRIVLFATSDGGSFGKILEELKISLPDDTEILEGKVFVGEQTLASIRQWVEGADV
jgi:flavodoxin